MIINYFTAQLGVVNQKRPEVWQSHLIPQLHYANLGKVLISIGDHNLVEQIKTVNNKDSIQAVLSIGDHNLVEQIKTVNNKDSIQAVLSIGNHNLVEQIKDTYITDSVGSVSLAIGDHSLSAWGVRAEVLDEDHIKVALSIGDHRLYEEQLDD